MKNGNRIPNFHGKRRSVFTHQGEEGAVTNLYVVAQMVLNQPKSFGASC